MKRPCAGPNCAKRRDHWCNPDEIRGKPVEVDVPDSLLETRKVFCSYTCAMEAGEFKLNNEG